MIEPENARSLGGTHVEITVASAGNKPPCNSPNIIRSTIKALAPPHVTVNGVIKVNIAVANCVTTNIIFPPNRSDRRPPGICVNT